jgi:hypothetical protein
MVWIGTPQNLTISNPFCQESNMSLRITATSTPALEKAKGMKRNRIYRWGDLWGILAGQEWRVERRIPLSSEVEQIELVDVHAPPPRVDDLWEEDVYEFEDGSEWNGLHTFVGSPEAAKKWCLKSGILFPNVNMSNKTNTPMNQNQNQKQAQSVRPVQKPVQKSGSRCLISDE